MNRGGYTIVELMVSSFIATFLLSGLSLIAFMVMNFYNSLEAETQGPVALRQIRDRLYFAPASETEFAERGLLARSADAIGDYSLCPEDESQHADYETKPVALKYIHLPDMFDFREVWTNLNIAAKSPSTFSPMRINYAAPLQGGTSGVIAMPFDPIPFGKNQDPAADNYDLEVDPKDFDPGEKGALL